MAPVQDKLFKIGMEGLALLDEFLWQEQEVGRIKSTTTKANDHYHYQYYNSNIFMEVLKLSLSESRSSTAIKQLDFTVAY